jgi:mannan endo-1,4-beta-mannosidase
MPRLRIATTLLAITCLVAGASATEFVTVQGTAFHASGQPYHFAGTNCYYLMTWATDPSLRGSVDEVLEEAALMGLTVVRTWAFNDGDGWNALQTAPGVYQEQVFQGLDYVLQKCDALGLRVVLPLVNNWIDYGGMDQYVAWSPQAQFHDDFYTDDSTRAWYRNHCDRLSHRVNTFNGRTYRDDPTILAWELANEPRCPSDRSGNTLANWIDEMSAFIQGLDPNHLVTTGIEGFYDEDGGPWYLNGSEGVDFIRDHQVIGIDYATVHSWPDHWGFNLATTMGFLSRQLGDADAVVGKPCVLEEYGKARDATALAATHAAPFAGSDAVVGATHGAAGRAHYDPETYFSPGVTPYDVPGARPLRRGRARRESPSPWINPAHEPNKGRREQRLAGTATRDLFFQNYCDMLLARQAGGSSVWILYHDGYPDYDGFGIYYPADSSTVVILEAHAAAMAALGTTDAADDLTPASRAQRFLGTAVPNPFSPPATVRIEVAPAHDGASASCGVPAAEAVIRLYDLRGRMVRTLYQGMLGTNGVRLAWDGTMGNGLVAPSGAYFVRFESGASVEMQRVILLR